MSDEDWSDTVTRALRNMSAPHKAYRHAKWLDSVPIVGHLRARARLRRARRLAAQFEDADARGAATRVLAFLEKIRGTAVRADDLDTELRILLQPIIRDEETFWRTLDLAVERGHVGREHVVTNLRNGTVRHLITHLVVCRTCRAVRELAR